MCINQALNNSSAVIFILKGNRSHYFSYNFISKFLNCFLSRCSACVITVRSGSAASAYAASESTEWLTLMLCDLLYSEIINHVLENHSRVPYLVRLGHSVYNSCSEID